MPDPRVGHATTSTQPAQSPQMDPSRGPPRLLEGTPPRAPPTPKLFNTDDAAVALQAHELKEPKPLDKRSLDYILRTGLAGGLAGCAVRTRVTRSANSY